MNIGTRVRLEDGREGKVRNVEGEKLSIDMDDGTVEEVVKEAVTVIVMNLISRLFKWLFGK